MPQSQGIPAPPPAPAAPGVQIVVDVGGLRAQLAELNIQARALRATQNGLTRQLDRMRLDNPARPALQQQSADVGSQLAQVEGKIAEIQGRLAQQGVPYEGITGVPPRAQRNGPDPDMVVGMSFALAMCIALPLSIAFARRLWKGKPQPSAPSADRFNEVMDRLGRLELGIDSMAIEIERISEGQRFVTKVMAERPAQQPQPALGEGQAPLRALGAGSVEPIRVNNAESVKERLK